jgi:hypothetical protein
MKREKLKKQEEAIFTTEELTQLENLEILGGRNINELASNQYVLCQGGTTCSTNMYQCYCQVGCK